jgi:integrase
VRDERAILKRHARPVLGELRLEEIERTTIRNLLRKMSAKGIGAQTNRTHAVIRQVFAYALGEERLTVNPAAGLPPQADEAPRDRVLTDAELKALWGGLLAPIGLKKPARKDSTETVPLYVGRPLAIAVQLCALLLQRRNEIAGMSLGELDLDRGVWTIPAARMKGGQAHVVPLPPKAVELIREAIELAKDGRDKSPPVVFPGARDPEVPIRPDSVTHAMRDIMAALDLKNASPHDLRRTGATNLASERLAVAPFIVSKVLGHRSDLGGAAAVTLAHYALHDYAPEKRRALEAWEGLLLEIVGEAAKPSNVVAIGARA